MTTGLAMNPSSSSVPSVFTPLSTIACGLKGSLVKMCTSTSLSNVCASASVILACVASLSFISTFKVLDEEVTSLMEEIAFTFISNSNLYGDETAATRGTCALRLGALS